LVASLLDLTATKLEAILDRAEAKDYADLVALLHAGNPLTDGLGAFRTMFSGEPAVVLKAIGYFGDGDLSSIGAPDREMLRKARDAVREIPEVLWTSKQLV
jgi:hypothetical protein